MDASTEMVKQLQMLVTATRGVEVATLTASIINKMNHPVTLRDVIALRADVRSALNMDDSEGRKKQWLATQDQRLDHLHL